MLCGIEMSLTRVMFDLFVLLGIGRTYARRDSNPQRPASKAVTLSIELRAHYTIMVIIH